MYSYLKTVLVASLLLAGSHGSPTQVVKRKARTALDPALYTTIVRYGEFAAASIPSPCAVPPDGSTVLTYLEALDTNTEATVFRADNTKEIIISYRGSSSLQDFLTDFTFIPVNYTGCNGCMAHLGFYAAWQSIQKQSVQALQQALAANPGYGVTIVGHSLGGAIAAHAFTALKQRPELKIGNGWSMGEPRIGNAALADYTDSISGASDTNIGTFRRVTHANDGVPLLPPQSAGFQQSRTELWCNNNASGVPSAATSYRCYGQEAPDCVDGQGGVFINAAHVNYPGVNYVTACTKST